ncbi:MAG: hypothetical protein AM324_000545, partial [Candidatus Thorarchaeota archaeon SMTZ1-83]
RVEWVSAGEGKKWQGIMTQMSEVAEKNREASSAAAKPKKKPVSKKSTKAKAATKKKPKKPTEKKQSRK